MSTKMSTDLNISRPSSRVIRPPGGGSSFSIGGVSDAPTATPSKKGSNTFNISADNAMLGGVPPPPKPSNGIAAAPAPAAVPKSTVSGKVGIVVAGDLGTESITNAVSKALVVEGITGSVIAYASDVSIVPFTVKKLADSVDVVIVGSIFVDGSLANSLRTTLTQISLEKDKPVIPGFVVQDSLLEAKAVLPTLAPNWAKAAASVLGLQSGAITFAPAPEPVIAAPVEHTPDINDAGTLLAVLRESLNSHGARGIAGISRKFRIADDDHSGKIEYKEFVKVIGEHSLGWTPQQIRIVFDEFDADRSGSIDFDEFLIGIRGQLNERRTQMVLMAFEILDADHSGIVEINDISAKYSADKHPDVIAGRRSKEDVLREFLDTFDSIDKDGKVTPKEFIKYYSNCSSSIDDDDYFELMIRNAWHISGGEGWCANSSCRRVLVGHTDGNQTVEEIKNDLGIGADDKQKMIDKLIEQGVTDIEYIEGNDGVKFRPGQAAAAAVSSPSRNARAAPAAATNNDVAAGSRPTTATGRGRYNPAGQSSLQLF